MTDHDDEFRPLAEGDDELAALLRAARRERAPSGLHGRIAGRLGVATATAALGAAAKGATAKGAAAKGLTGALAMKVFVAGIALGVGGGVAVRFVGRPPAALPTAASAPERVVEGLPVEGSPRPALSAPATPESAVAATTPAPVRPATSAARGTNGASAAETLAEEARILQGAQRSLAAGDVTGASAALKTYRSRFPTGVLATERAVLDLEVRAASGDREVAPEAQRLLTQPAFGPYAARLRAMIR